MHNLIQICKFCILFSFCRKRKKTAMIEMKRIINYLTITPHISFFYNFYANFYNLKKLSEKKTVCSVENGL